MGGVRVQVAECDAAKATEILADSLPASIVWDENEEPFEQPQCPKCESLDIEYLALNRPLTFGLLYFSLPLPILSDRWHCNACDAEWVDEP